MTTRHDAAAAGVPTTGMLDTRIGVLEVKHGYPTDATVAKLFDEMDFQRAVQAYLWALPYVSLGQFQSEQRDRFGARNLDFVDYLDLKDRVGILTANATTPYSMAFPNLAETGPLVVEVPPGPTAGGIADFWQRPLTDTGVLGPEQLQIVFCPYCRGIVNNGRRRRQSANRDYADTLSAITY